MTWGKKVITELRIDGRRVPLDYSVQTEHGTYDTVQIENLPVEDTMRVRTVRRNRHERRRRAALERKKR